MVESLAHQDNLRALLLQLLQASQSVRLEIGLHFVLEILFAQQVESISAHPAQHAIDDPRRKHPVARV